MPAEDPIPSAAQGLIEDIWARADNAATPTETAAIRDEADAILARHLERALRDAGIAADARGEQIRGVRMDSATAESLEIELRRLRDRLKGRGLRRRHAARQSFSTEMREGMRWALDLASWIFLLGPPIFAAALLVAGALGEVAAPSGSALLGMAIVWALIAPLGLKMRRSARWNPEHARADAAAAREFDLFAGTFEWGKRIPREHTARGGNVSPPLFWAAPPDGTAELALVMYRTDRDGSSPADRTHWLGWGIDPSGRALAAGEAPPIEGRNDFGDIGYRGPTGEGESLYHFVLYALASPLGLPVGASRAEVEAALYGRVEGVAETVGT